MSFGTACCSYLVSMVLVQNGVSGFCYAYQLFVSPS